MHILIIEDDTELAEAIADYLETQGAVCDFAYNGLSGIQLAKNNNFDAIILDLMLPKLGGFNVCRALRDAEVLTPILMLTASDTEQEQLMGFQLGIDDFVVKPSPMPIVWARLQAIIRRKQPQGKLLIIGELSLHLKQHRVSRQQVPLKLTLTEWKILELLAIRSPDVVSRSEIEKHVWGDREVEQGNFNVHLHGLRKSVDKPFDYPMIETVVNVGLRLNSKTSQKHDTSY